MTPPSPHPPTPPAPPPFPRRAPPSLPHLHPITPALLLLFLLLASLLPTSHAQPNPEPNPTPATTPLSSARDILRLSPEQADRKLPARIRGVVTLSARRGDLLFVQDPSAGIYVYFKDNFPPQGSFIEAAGTTAKGLFSPIVAADTLTVLSQTNLPTPIPLAIEDLAFGSHDSQWVELRGVVTRQQVDWGHLVLNLASGNANLPIRIIDFDPASIVTARRDSWEGRVDGGGLVRGGATVGPSTMRDCASGPISVSAPHPNSPRLFPG